MNISYMTPLYLLSIEDNLSISHAYESHSYKDVSPEVALPYNKSLYCSSNGLFIDLKAQNH